MQRVQREDNDEGTQSETARAEPEEVPSDEDACLTDKVSDPDGPVVCLVDYRRFLEWPLPVVDKATAGEDSKVVSLQCWEILERVVSRGFEGLKGRQLGAIELDWRSTGEGVLSSVWELLVLEATIRRDHSWTLQGACLYRAKRDTAVDHLLESDTFFVVLNKQIINSSLWLSLHAPARDVTGTLLEQKILRIEMPSRNHIAQPSLRRHRNALVGWHRAAYCTYYETTLEGRAVALTPGGRRFDDIHYWIDGAAHPPDSAVLAAQLDRIEKKVIANQRTLIFGLLAAVAVSVLGWMF